MGKMNGEAMKSIWTDMVGKYAVAAMKCGLWLTVGLSKITNPVMTQLCKIKGIPMPISDIDVKKFLDKMLVESEKLGSRFSFAKFAYGEDKPNTITAYTRGEKVAFEENYQPAKNSLYTSILDHHKRCEQITDEMIAYGFVLHTKEAKDAQIKEVLTWNDDAFDAMKRVLKKHKGLASQNMEVVSQEHSAASQDFSSAKVVKPKKTKTKKPTKTASKKKTTTKKSSKTTKAKKSKGTKKR